jgi:hypothetical protein
VTTELRPRGTVVGLGAAACAVCCAPPLMAGLGLAGVGLTATLFTAVLAGLSFAVVVALVTAVALLVRRRHEPARREQARPPEDVEITLRPHR